MRPFINFSVLLIISAANNVISQAVTPTEGPSCGYLAKKIYCFGGLTSDPVMNMLDISNSSGKTADELKTMWSRITTNSGSYEIIPRDTAQTMQMPDGKNLLVSGGWSHTGRKLTSQTLTFDGESQSWNQYQNYTEGSYGNRQISHASSSYVPGYGVGFFGGMEIDYLPVLNSPYTYPGVNVTQHEDPSSNMRFIGYTSLVFFDIRNPSSPWSTYPTQNNRPSVFTLHQKSIFDPKSNRIFFIGGAYYNAAIQQTYYPLDSAMTFDLTKGEWGTQAFNGQIPSQRMDHTVTLIQSTQRHVLLYGGQNFNLNNIAAHDYCFTLDLDTYRWVPHTFDADSNVSLPRSRHAAVTVNNNTIFIVFGRDGTETNTLAVLMLNVTTPTKITLLDNYESSSPISSPTATETTDTGSTEKAKLSAGATIGIAVGVTAAGLVAIAAITFCVLRKIKNKKKSVLLQAAELQQLQKQQKEESLMEVNWDDIDNKYTEYPGYFASSKDITVVANNLSISDNPSLVAAQNQNPKPGYKNASVQLPDIEYAPAQHPDVASRIRKPDAV